MSRTVRRWVATCAVAVHEDRHPPMRCGFNDRKDPTLHTTSEAAVRESIRHLTEQHDLHGAREVSIQRTYAPRVLEKEEIIS